MGGIINQGSKIQNLGTLQKPIMEQALEKTHVGWMIKCTEELVLFSLFNLERTCELLTSPKCILMHIWATDCEV